LARISVPLASPRSSAVARPPSRDKVPEAPSAVTVRSNSITPPPIAPAAPWYRAPGQPPASVAAVAARSAGSVRASENTSAIPAATATTTPARVSGHAGRRFAGSRGVAGAALAADVPVERGVDSGRDSASALRPSSVRPASSGSGPDDRPSTAGGAWAFRSGGGTRPVPPPGGLGRAAVGAAPVSTALVGAALEGTTSCGAVPDRAGASAAPIVGMGSVASARRPGASAAAGTAGMPCPATGAVFRMAPP
jgi:hypothetical protein